MLGDDGAGLSAGERQRVALARAFLRDAPLLLLDEPTANLDGQTEESVLDAVRRLMVGRTVLIVAHRPSLLALADRVVDLAPVAAASVMAATTVRTARRRRGWRRCGRTLGIARPAAGRLLLAAPAGGRCHRRRHRAHGHRGLADLEGRRSTPTSRTLALAIVGVQFFGLSRGFFRYGERLVGHDAAFRLLADLRVQGLRAARAARAGRPAGLPAGRPAGPHRPGRRLAAGPGPPGHPAVRHRRAGGRRSPWPSCGGCCRRPGSILAVALLLAATVVPWLTGRPRPAGGSRGSPAPVATWRGGRRPHRGRGRAGRLRCHRTPRSRTIRDQDAELTRHRRGIGRHRRASALALTTLLAGLASWGCLLVGIPAVATGRLDATELAVITLIPLAAFELVVGLPVATQALQRVRQAAARVFEVTDAPDPGDRARGSRCRCPTAPTTSRPGRCGRGYPERRRPALRGVDLPLARRTPGGGGRAERGRQVDAGRGARSGSCPYAAGSVALNGVAVDRLAGDDVRTVVGLVGQDAYLFDATLAENLRIGRRAPPTTSCATSSTGSGSPAGSASCPTGLATEVGRHGARLSGGQRQRVARGPRPARRLPGAGARRAGRAPRPGGGRRPDRATSWR